MLKRFFLGSILISLAISLTSCPSPYTLGFPGEYPVASYQTKFGDNYPVSIFYPDTEPRLSNLPIVIFNTGWNQPRGTYDGYATQLAQWGFIAVTRFYPSPGLLWFGDDHVPWQVDQSMELVSWLGSENTRVDSPLYGLVDASTVGTTGHSLGATVAILHAVDDPRVKAMVSLDAGYAGEENSPELLLAQTDASLMYIISADGGWCAQAPGTTLPLFDISQPNAAEVIISNSDHMDFEDSMVGMNYFGQVFCPSAPAPPSPQEVRDIATRYMIAWFNVYLKGNTEFERYYVGAEAQQDIDAGLVSIRTKFEE